MIQGLFLQGYIASGSGTAAAAAELHAVLFSLTDTQRNGEPERRGRERENSGQICFVFQRKR